MADGPRRTVVRCGLLGVMVQVVNGNLKPDKSFFANADGESLWD